MTTTPTTILREHPAKFSEDILEALRLRVRDEWRLVNFERPMAEKRPITVFDPFAGVGRVHRIANVGRVETFGMELEPEWAGFHEQTWVGDSLRYMLTTDDRYDVVVTSPCYGNRLADAHDARDGSVRKSYRHVLGRMPSEGSSTTMPWGQRYWAFHARAYRLIWRILKPNGLLLLNVSDFVKADRVIHAVEWHQGACWGVGLVQDKRALAVPTRRLRLGENRDARVEHEVILRFRRPAGNGSDA